MSRRGGWDEVLAARVREAIGASAREQLLMGTLGFVVDGRLCCAVTSDGLLVRAPDRAALLKLSHVTEARLGKRTMTAFVRVAAEGVATPRMLSGWVKRALSSGSRGKRRSRSRA